MAEQTRKLVLRNYFFLPITAVSPDGKQQVTVARSLSGWLAEAKLHSSKSRDRSRFLRSIKDRLEGIDRIRTEMLEEHYKDKKGRLCFIDAEGKKTFDVKKKKRYDIQKEEEFDKVWNEYLEEKYIIVVDAANNEMMNSIKAILLETNDEFGGQEAARYDEWCEAFESIWAKEEDKPKEPKVKEKEKETKPKEVQQETKK